LIETAQRKSQELLEIIVVEADLVVDAWHQQQKELVEAAGSDKEAWKRLVDRLHMLPPPNVRYVSKLRAFYADVVEISNRSNKQSEELSAYIGNTFDVIYYRGIAQKLFDEIISEGEHSEAERSSARNTRLKELGKIVELLYDEVANLKALALSIKRRLI
jgi:hypothetical protein